MKQGFTLVELLVVLGVLGILFGLISINLVNSYRTPVLTGTKELFIADTRGQQLKAMTNDTYYGIHMNTASYVLFQGSSYNQNASTNFTINLCNSCQFQNVTFPSSEIIFTPVSGEIQNWSSTTDSVNIKDIQDNVSSIFQINKYGATF